MGSTLVPLRRGANPDRAMITAFSRINEMADHLGMTSVVKDGACDLYRMVVKPGQPLLGKSHAAMYAACLYTSCRQAGLAAPFAFVCLPDLSGLYLG
jgi:transcription initiation factor TFIIB